MHGLGEQKQQGLIASRAAPICRPGSSTGGSAQLSTHSCSRPTGWVNAHRGLTQLLLQHFAAGMGNPHHDAEQWHFLFFFTISIYCSETLIQRALSRLAL